ncbi:hypothetical protein BDW75DRAFT_244767 [Aspergillus navahoensis]
MLAQKPAATPDTQALKADGRDTYLTTTFNAASTLKKTQHSRYPSADGLKNLVAPVLNAEFPYPPFGGASDYDTSGDGKWVAYRKNKALDLPRANHTTAYFYLVLHQGSETAPISSPDSAPEDIEGGSNSPSYRSLADIWSGDSLL